MIDLRSDFLSTPTPAMHAAMARAAERDKGYGPREDPLQSELEQHGAHLLGKEDALFVPTCTMANLLAVMVVARRGDAVLLDEAGHTMNSESGSLAAVAGVMTVPLPSRHGRVAPHDISAALRQGSLQQPDTRMVLLENTHNKAGGVAVDSAHFAAVRQAMGTRWLHLDGSRLLNAAVALGESAQALARDADSVSLSLNKALAAPAGALLAGPAAFIEEATRLRQQLGGGWRPVGMLAAAALVGLRTMVARLHEDHAHARQLAQTLAASGLVSIDMSTVQTNIVRARLDTTRLPAARLVTTLREAGVLVQAGADGAMRLVTYPDITPPMVRQACEALSRALS